MLRRVKGKRWLLLLVVLTSIVGFIGCELCNRRLYLYRETPEKLQPPANMALLITHPDIVAAISAKPGNYPGGGPWAQDLPAYETEAYRLSLERLDGKRVYQGLCLDTTPTTSCEVRPGSRRVQAKLELFGPWGRESKQEEVTLQLEPGRCYFLRPDWEQLQSKNFVLKVEPLPDAYTPDLRARVIDWERKNSKGKTLVD